jgi:hypothetical protein
VRGRWREVNCLLSVLGSPFSVVGLPVWDGRLGVADIYLSSEIKGRCEWVPKVRRLYLVLQFGC